MNALKKAFGWIKNPHGFLLILIYVLAVLSVTGAILLVVFFELDSAIGIFAYILFATAALTLGFSIYTFIKVAPLLKQKIKQKLAKHEFTGKLMQNYGFRTIVFSVLSLTISVGYAVLNGVIGIISGSVWYGSLAAYYILLVFMRGGVLFYHKNKRAKKFAPAIQTSEIMLNDKAKKINEIKTYRTCGCCLIIMPLALSVAILQMVSSNKGFEHAGLMIFAAAAYTFYKITMSVINFVKARKNQDMTVQAIRNINLADAMVSILALQTAMFREFSAGISVGWANALTGAAVCALTAALGIFMLVNSNLKLKKLQRGKNNGQQI